MEGYNLDWNTILHTSMADLYMLRYVTDEILQKKQEAIKEAEERAKKEKGGVVT